MKINEINDSNVPDIEILNILFSHICFLITLSLQNKLCTCFYKLISFSKLWFNTTRKNDWIRPLSTKVSIWGKTYFLIYLFLLLRIGSRFTIFTCLRINIAVDKSIVRIFFIGSMKTQEYFATQNFFLTFI